jgi:hypothetical protein
MTDIHQDKQHDQFIIYAIHRDRGFVIGYAPFMPLQRCSFWNSTNNLFVYSVPVLFNNDKSTSNQLYTFVQIAEEI